MAVETIGPGLAGAGIGLRHEELEAALFVCRQGRRALEGTVEAGIVGGQGEEVLFEGERHFFRSDARRTEGGLESGGVVPRFG